MIGLRLAFVVSSASAFSASAPPLYLRPCGAAAAAGGVDSSRWSAGVLALRSTQFDEAVESSSLSSSSSDEKNNPLQQPLESSSSSDCPTSSASLVEVPADLETTIVGEEISTLESFAWKGAVVALCALWASNFAAAKLIMAEPGIDSALYAVTRFSLAALALAPGAVAAVRRGAIDWETARGAAVCGAWVAFGYLGQTLGLLTTTASRSCVICSLHCVFVAIVAEWMRVQRKAQIGVQVPFDTIRLLPAVVAVAGVAIVELQGAAGDPTIGDAVSFAQPIGFGLGYLQLEELMRKRPEAALPVSAIKLLVVAAASLAYFELSPLFSAGNLAEGLVAMAPRIPDVGAVLSSPVALGGILYTSLVTTALALWVESIAFKRVPATDASIILTTEPLFAAGAGALTLGETFGTSDYVGASLIVGACILAVVLEDRNAEASCDPYSPEDCVPERSTPFVE